MLVLAPASKIFNFANFNYSFADEDALIKKLIYYTTG